MLRHGAAQQHHVHVMMKRLFLLKRFALLLHPREMDIVSRNILTSTTVKFFGMHRFYTSDMAMRLRFELAL